MENYKVYKHTFPNNKVYIGITKSKYIKNRWGKNGSCYKGQFVYRAIKKYNWENIKHEILFDSLTKKRAEEKEIELISFYKSNQRKYGYNLDAGGNGSNRISEETRQKLSTSHKGQYFSKETRKRLSISQLQRHDKLKIYCFEDNKVYTAHELLKKYKKISHIYSCCRNKRMTAFKKYWCYIEDKNTYKVKTREAYNKIKIIDTQTNKQYESMSECAKDLNISLALLSKKINKKGETRWKKQVGKH